MKTSVVIGNVGKADHAVALHVRGDLKTGRSIELEFCPGDKQVVLSQVDLNNLAGTVNRLAGPLLEDHR